MTAEAPRYSPRTALGPKFGAVRSSFGGTRSLAVNGGALIVNVIVSGIGGFAFWIIAARSVPPSVVAEATAMVTTMLGVVMISQQSLVVNVPILVAGSPRPRRLAGQAYLAALSLTTVTALLYIVFGTRLASGLAYLRDLRLSIVFFVGCVLWSVFSLQDAVLTGVRRGKLVLLENTVWGIARLAFVAALPLVGIQLGVGWLVGAWIVPAAVLVAAVSYVLFVRADSPLRTPLGSHHVDRRALFSHLGAEHLGALTNGLITLFIPAIALTTLGARAAAPFLAAYAFLVVSENAIGSFAQAFAVEIRRHGHASRNLIYMTCVLLGGFSLVAIPMGKFFGDDLMALFGPSYREPGGAVLAVLVLGLPARCVWMLSSAANRLRGAGWRNLAQQVAYCVGFFASVAIGNIDTGVSLAVCLVVGRFVAAAISLRYLIELRSPQPRSGVAGVASTA